jgi:geranylgeranyl transferase type-2 subunit beta
MSFSYLERLTIHLTAGAALLPISVVDKHLTYLLHKQLPDGGWSGREGGSDLYYTSFALRSLAILGQLEGRIAEQAAHFLRSKLDTQQSVVDLLSLVYGGRLIQAACGLDPFAEVSIPWEDRLESWLNALRRSDGGFAKTPQGHAGSTYQTFLVTICFELLGKTLPQADEAARFLMNQRQSDGGFLEVRVAKRSGTNPTAAAIGALKTLGCLTEDTSAGVIEFLAEQQVEGSGFAANTRMPMADLLSTFTASLTLHDLNALDQVELGDVKNYVHSMERPGGGFAGFELDPADDVEYTFYGLGTLAILAGKEGDFER